MTGFIPVTFDQTVYFKNLTLIVGGENASKCYIWAYKSDFTGIGYYAANTGTNGGMVVDENNAIQSIRIGGGCGFTVTPTDVAYIRISAEEITDASIITVNEPID